MSPRLPHLEEMCQSLLAAPSVSSMVPVHDMSNRAVIELLAGWLDALGFTVEIQALDVPGKFNLVASAGRGPGGLVLSGHTDTVPYDERRWNHDPFAATFDDGRMYGLGACDMKGFFAIVLEVLAQIPLEKLRAPLFVVATADEESSMSGARALAAAGAPRARHVLIGEPTGLKPVRLHKGIMMEALKVIGKSGHSSDPAYGRNAIEGVHAVLGALLDWRAELQAGHRDEDFRVPVPTLNFGHVHGGDNPNRICGDCELQIDLRPLPGMEIEALRVALVARANSALNGTGMTLESTALFGGVPALATPAEAEIVRVAERFSGHAAGSVDFATEGPLFAALGCDTVILGPGDIAQAHQPDEYLSLDQVAPMQRLLAAMIDHFCLDPGDAGERVA